MTTKKTSVIGFPRIGKKRELKFASEKFFKGEVSENELRKVAAEIRLYGWQKQQEAGIDFLGVTYGFVAYDEARLVEQHPQ